LHLEEIPSLLSEIVVRHHVLPLSILFHQCRTWS
jgi:hypothetical protein